MDDLSCFAFDTWYDDVLKDLRDKELSERDIACEAFHAGMQYARKSLSLVVVKKGSKHFRIFEGRPGDFLHLEDDEAIMSGAMGVSNA